MVEYLLSKCKALNSNPSIIKGKRKKKKEREASTHKQMDNILHSWIGKKDTDKNVYTTQSNLQIHCNPCQNTNIVHRNKNNSPKMCTYQ
jgi:hypothetical protein